MQLPSAKKFDSRLSIFQNGFSLWTLGQRLSKMFPSAQIGSSEARINYKVCQSPREATVITWQGQCFYLPQGGTECFPKGAVEDRDIHSVSMTTLSFAMGLWCSHILVTLKFDHSFPDGPSGCCKKTHSGWHLGENITPSWFHRKKRWYDSLGSCLPINIHYSVPNSAPESEGVCNINLCRN